MAAALRTADETGTLGDDSFGNFGRLAMLYLVVVIVLVAALTAFAPRGGSGRR